jgi:hypothetical protein
MEHNMNNLYEARGNMFARIHKSVTGMPDSVVEDAKSRGLLPSVLTEDGTYTGMEEAEFIGPVHPNAADEFINSLR